MEHFVPLAQLPAGLTFPKQFADRISYDAARHRLVYHGVMRKPDYDALARLSGDLAYLDALQELFRVATCKTPPAPRWRKSALIGIGLVAAVVVLAGWLWQTHNANAGRASEPVAAIE